MSAYVPTLCRVDPPAVGVEQARIGILALYQAWQQSREKNCDVWEFALSLNELLRLGLDRSDVRQLLYQGFAEHGVEVVRCGKTKPRRFRSVGALTLPLGTSLVLAPAGVVLAEQLLATASTSEHCTKPLPPTAKPTWDPDRRELRWGETLIKRFRQRAPDQERILAAFEEEDWPPQIDDPLPRKGTMKDKAAKRRLHYTLKHLNRYHRVRRLRFQGDGTGEGVLWCLVGPKP